jgi:mannose-6-phosphate isomerase-like protein (cupin superfamily)
METWHCPTLERPAFAGYAHGFDVVRMRRAGLVLHYYAPKGTDPQPPHDQDALSIVISGHGQFVNGSLKVEFGPGEAMFVPARATRRSEGFSSDFAC